ncbi:hypothetical protein IV203_036279 [Nitzschia inconspicua]|uniref:Uncharacterized protein n=1 Tax=Nitzschia inconspicua TaxID=303405 RepID=A0A9K3LG56_9STRA|nr:hypothetical protein IV203_036279 [Nitzschia inconspicua]
MDCVTQPIPSNVLQSSNYCSWKKNLQDCYQMLEKRIIHTSSWVFLGGRDMSTLADFMSRKWPYHDDQTVKVTTRRHPCQNLLYFGLPPPGYPWVAPNASLGEGPTAYGLEHPYCMDCRNCWNVLVDASQEQTQRYIEYLVVEYSRDVSIQTSFTNTTQETVSYHLQMKQPEVCVVSVGLFDFSIPNLSQEVFLFNMERYISLLQRACENVVWLSIPAIVEDESIPQYQNCELQQRNNAIMDMLTEKNHPNVFIMDVWEKTLKSDHSSFLQLSSQFHTVIVRLFVALVVGEGDVTVTTGSTGDFSM